MSRLQLRRASARHRFLTPAPRKRSLHRTERNFDPTARTGIEDLYEQKDLGSESNGVEGKLSPRDFCLTEPAFRTKDPCNGSITFTVEANMYTPPASPDRFESERFELTPELRNLFKKLPTIQGTQKLATLIEVFQKENPKEPLRYEYDIFPIFSQ